MKRILAILLTVSVVSGCEKLEQTVLDGFALGTTFHIIVRDREDRADMRVQIDSVFALANSSLSIYNPYSRLSRINNNETDTADVHIIYCVEMAERISRETDGLYDVTVKPLVDAWGFGKEGIKNTTPNIDSLLPFVGYEKVRIDGMRIIKSNPGVQLALNSIAKGYTVDLLAQMIEAQGITNYLVEVGGEIVCKGKNSKNKDWQIGIDKPIDGNFVPGEDVQVVIQMSGHGLATSGNYRNFHTDDTGRKISHTLNPKTGYSQTNNLLSVTIIAENCATADAYTTAMMVVGLERAKEILLAHDDLAGYLIYADQGGNFQTFISPALERMIVVP